MSTPGGLGRLPADDLRDLNHLMRTARPLAFVEPIQALPSAYTYKRGIILDQGQTGTCVEHSLEAKLRGSPCAVGPTRVPPRYEVYDEAITLDEFPSNNVDPLRQYGTSIRAGCKVLQSKGLVRDYVWAFSVDDILHWILNGQGGVVFGIDWYSGMNEPTESEGIIRATGRLEGGHAIYCYGANRTTGLFDLQQSWGPEYGGWHTRGIPRANGEKVCKGCVRLPFDDMHRLLSGNGEAVSIMEIPYTRKKAVAPC